MRDITTHFMVPSGDGGDHVSAGRVPFDIGRLIVLPAGHGGEVVGVDELQRSNFAALGEHNVLANR